MLYLLQSILKRLRDWLKGKKFIVCQLLSQKSVLKAQRLQFSLSRRQTTMSRNQSLVLPHHIPHQMGHLVDKRSSKIKGGQNIHHSSKRGISLLYFLQVFIPLKLQIANTLLYSLLLSTVSVEPKNLPVASSAERQSSISMMGIPRQIN